MKYVCRHWITQGILVVRRKNNGFIFRDFFFTGDYCVFVDQQVSENDVLFQEPVPQPLLFVVHLNIVNLIYCISGKYKIKFISNFHGPWNSHKFYLYPFIPIMIGMLVSLYSRLV